MVCLDLIVGGSLIGVVLVSVLVIGFGFVLIIFGVVGLEL